ncbi:1-deoxy-D-xylulose-5-phosphate synthase [Variovorax paradoxus]|uniref:1-deoxy-D-xylulose-5-phosphate synthase n=1 Tax=Variovorax paradoxus TaxID=34073 RepID=UPI003D65BB47
MDLMKSRIMYIEAKSGGLTGPARIGRVTCSKSGATLYYGGKAFRSLKGSGFKSNYFDVETGEHYRISGPRKDGKDALYATHVRPDIDDDVQHEYWSKIRGVASSSEDVKQVT